MKNNTITTVGLIKGRHEMPVDQYIFENEIEDVFNFLRMKKHILDFLVEKVGLEIVKGQALNQDNLYDENEDKDLYTPVDVWKGKKKLVVYITGLTCVTAQLIQLCALNGVDLTLMHYNNATGEYVAQNIFY